MGRKLDLGELTEEEEKIILQVIKRDYDVRKVESDRIGQLSEDVKKEENKKKTLVREAKLPSDSLCAKCGNKFVWLINPKAQCEGCELYFCKNKIECITYDKVSKKCFCSACVKQRELTSYAGEWFYSRIKGKFRRHGGAKVSREINKKRKSQKSGSDSSPSMRKSRQQNTDDSTGSPSSSIVSSPTSLRRHPSDRQHDFVSVTSREEVSSSEIDARTFQIHSQIVPTIVEKSLESAPRQSNDMEVQTDNQPDAYLHAIKTELEITISAILLPKLEELKQSQLEHQNEIDRQQKTEEAIRIAEDMIDNALERARERHQPQLDEENILLAKYLSDSKTELMTKVATQLHVEQMPPKSCQSSVREAGTMTETSDSEMESVSSASGRRRHKDIPLTDRLSTLSPDSLRRSVGSSTSSITQGVVLQKTQLVARADIDSSLEEILVDHGIHISGSSSPQEFSTAITFTAVGKNPRLRSDDTDTSDEETSQNLLAADENWPVPEARPRLSHFGLTRDANSTEAIMSLEGTESPYTGLIDGDNDVITSSDREHVAEEPIMATQVRRSDEPFSPQSLVAMQVEMVETLPEKKPRLPLAVAVNPALIKSLSQELQTDEKELLQPESPRSPPALEEVIQPVERSTIESSVSLDLDNEESSESSSSSESDPEKTPTLARRINQYLKPQRHSAASVTSPTEKRSLTGDENLMANREGLDEKFAEVLAARIIEPVVKEGGRSRKSSSESSHSSDDDRVTPVPTPIPSSAVMSQPPTTTERHEAEVSAAAMAIVNTKAIIVLSDAVETALGSESSTSSSSNSSRKSSKQENVETLRLIDQAEQKIYENAAKTYILEEKLDQIETVAANSDSSDPSIKQVMQDIEAEIDKAERQMEEIRHGEERQLVRGKSIDVILEELRGAGLEVQKGGYRRSTSTDSRSSYKRAPSLDSTAIAAGTTHKAFHSRYSLPAQPSKTEESRPINAIDKENPSWMKNTFTVVPGRSGPDLFKPASHSTPKAKSSSVSSNSSHSICSDYEEPIERTPPPVVADLKERTELQATIASILSRSSRVGQMPYIERKLDANANANNSATPGEPFKETPGPCNPFARGISHSETSESSVDDSSANESKSHDVTAGATAVVTSGVLIQSENINVVNIVPAQASATDKATTSAVESSSVSSRSSVCLEISDDEELIESSSYEPGLPVDESIIAKGPSPIMEEEEASPHRSDSESSSSVSVKEKAIAAGSFNAIVAKFETGDSQKGRSSSSESGSEHSKAQIKQESDTTERKLDNISFDAKSHTVDVAILKESSRVLVREESHDEKGSGKDDSSSSSSGASEKDEVIRARSFNAIVAKFETGDSQKGQSSSSESGSEHSEADITENKIDLISIDSKSHTVDIVVVKESAPVFVQEESHDETGSGKGTSSSSSSAGSVKEEVIAAPSFNAIVAKFETGDSQKGQSSSSESGSKYSEPLIKQELDVTGKKDCNKSIDAKTPELVLKFLTQPKETGSVKSETSARSHNSLEDFDEKSSVKSKSSATSSTASEKSKREKIESIEVATGIRSATTITATEKSTDEKIESIEFTTVKISEQTEHSFEEISSDRPENKGKERRERKSSETSSKKSASRSGLFENLSIDEQREMARIALLHLPETIIADDKYQTKRVNVVTSETPQHDVTPTLQQPATPQQELAPSVAPEEVRAMAEVRSEESSSTSSSSGDFTPKPKRRFLKSNGTRLSKHARTKTGNGHIQVSTSDKKGTTNDITN